MRIIKIFLPLVLLAAILFTTAGCHMKIDPAKPSAGPSASPTASAKPTEKASAAPSASPSGDASQSPSAGPSGSPDASGMPTGGIDGFMEGVVVDPETVPELIELLAKHKDLQGLAVQSITYKLYEGQQAYYVVLQGEGDASKTVYVLADDTVIIE
jgi:hypothetical protein